MGKEEQDSVSRRGFLKGLSTTLAASAVGAGAEAAEAAGQAGTAQTLSGTVPVSLTVNGKPATARVDVRRTLLEMLRTDLDLTGAKQVCDRGTCGACTVIVNGKTVYSCMTLAVDAEGTKVETIEGLEKNGKLHPVQEAFVKHDALQCGFCTPGMVMSCKALLDKNPKPTLDQIKEGCSGNLCRCGTYPHIFTAMLEASGQGGKK